MNDLLKAYLFTVCLAAVLAVVGYVVPRADRAEEAIDRVAEGLLTGALGFFVGNSVKGPKLVDPASTENKENQNG